MTKTMLFGPLGRMLPIPYPEADMGWDFNRRVEETELLSGGTHVYEAPTTFKRYKLQYKGGTAGLQNLMDIYNGVYGKGPYYLLDFNYTTGNLLPTRWASAYMLGHIAGAWCSPALNAAPAALAGETVTFTNLGQFTELGEQLTLPCVPDKPMYLRAWGSSSGEAAVVVYLRNAATGEWETGIEVLPTAAPADRAIVSQADAAAGKYDAVRLRLKVSTGATLTLDHLNLLDSAGVSVRKPGLGVGAVSFTGYLSGNIVTKRFDRIGLSLDLVEIE